MGLFSRKPKLQDEALSDLAQMFISFPDDPTPGAELLADARLDFTVESLSRVDDYLDEMRKRQIEDNDYCILVLRCGAYVGEVTKRGRFYFLRTTRSCTGVWLQRIMAETLWRLARRSVRQPNCLRRRRIFGCREASCIPFQLKMMPWRQGGGTAGVFDDTPRMATPAFAGAGSAANKGSA